MVNKELIERFLKNECTAEEQQLVVDYFAAHPEEFEQYLDENEWEQFEAPENTDAALSRKLFEKIKAQINRKERRIRIIRRLTAAAAVTLVVGLGWKFLSNEKVASAPIVAQVQKKDSAVVVTRHETNYTGKDKTIQLEDGSLIILSDKSEVSYQLPFTTTRNISVTGKAFFKVAKDKTKPFIVTSGPITTTALGTEFTVAARKGTGHIKVRLYEGKVVIKAVSRANRHLKQDVYLLPGEEFVYGETIAAKKLAFKLNTTPMEPEQIMAQETIADDPSIPQNAKGSWFQFNNRPVSEVLDQLAEIYKVEIVYNKKDVQNSYFIGKYNSTDSVENILKRIGILNRLTITKNGNAFIITR